MILYRLVHHIKEIDILTRQAPDPAAAAHWCLRELGARTGLRVLVLDRHAVAGERVTQAGDEVLDALRDGLAVGSDVDATREAARALLASLQEELMAFDQGDAYVGSDRLERAWGELARL